MLVSALPLSAVKTWNPSASKTTVRKRVSKAVELVESAIDEMLAYYAFPKEHWRRIRTNNPLERLMCEIPRRTRVVGAYPDGQTSSTVVPSSACRRMKAICCSLNRDFFMENPPPSQEWIN